MAALTPRANHERNHASGSGGTLGGLRCGIILEIKELFLALTRNARIP